MSLQKAAVLRRIALGISVLAATQMAGAASAPQIKTLLKPEVYQRVVQDRQVMTHASLDPAGVAGSRYSYYAAMIVRASIRQTRKVLTDYSLYSKMIPYIDKTIYDPKTHVLELSGAIFGYRLRSSIEFEETGDHWIRFRIIRGDFTGMTGNILFEHEGPVDTLVYLGGNLTAAKWPPKFIIERGAEIVFGFTAKRMRSYISEQTSGS